MVAQQANPPDDSRRRFSAEVEAQLATALAEDAELSVEAGVSDGLHVALTLAARDARERDLSPQELLIAFKHVEQRLPIADSAAHRDKVRGRIISSLLRAFYQA